MLSVRQVALPVVPACSLAGTELQSVAVKGAAGFSKLLQERRGARESALPGVSSILSDFTTPSSTSIE